MSSIELSDYRAEFPILEHQVQLSSCSQSALSMRVKKAINQYMDSWEKEGMDWMGWMEAVEASRVSFARLINAEVEEVAVVPSVSHAVSAIATSLEIKGDKNQVLVTDMDFPTIGHVWLAQKDMTVNFISSEQGQIPLEAYQKNIEDHTLITSISHVSYYNGFQQDIEQIARIAHAKGSYLFVDAYQSAGNVKIDVKQMGVDFLATGLQKYLLGIPGIAFLYVNKEVAKKLQPRVTGWFGQENPFAFDVERLEFAEGARKFDAGTPPMINGFAAQAALDFLLEVGMDRIEPHLKKLSRFALQYAAERGLAVRSPLDVQIKGSNTAIFVPNASEVEQRMKQRGIIVASRLNVIRIAPHFYNTEGDVKKAIDVLCEEIKV
ncbi:aminotransferase class V-fold PLP-dependent enzyme [Ammoniphilus sp. CFH 90114]|uniref:aminotransferase class V-fold PLP-dependent enzyme n=1 Tax=Ammoniphilus sp. CFH 90114 TaxID=2493665 RepID=UPI00100EBE66|nr:aminotransferase class V-fold PLP-dependent enzyme [Ammoniphilus sp. CFH 90114]RXT08023.1 aminotransferase class V-fold PLP-dependent enzyme [Ammoniphilus sp. CFH 90114]